MYNTASSPNLTGCSFEKNQLGMYNTGSSPVLSGCDFIGNSAGGMANYAGSSPVITGCSFIENYATQYGGAIYSNGSSASISGCTFTRNTAGDLIAGYPGEGGALHAWGTLQTNVVNCIFDGNQAARQGGAALGNLMMVNCIFSGNTAPVGAAVIYAAGVVNCTFSANTSQELGGVIAFADQIVNCVVWGNSSLYAPLSGSFTKPSYSDIEGGAEGIGNIAADPSFYRKPDPGPDEKWGTTDDDYGDLRIRGSAIVDAGDSSAVPANVIQDLAGNNRFQDLQSIPDTGIGPAPVVDMGAFEAGPGVVADAGGPYFAAPGHPITLSGIGRSGVPGSLTFEWEWSGDGQFDDGVGSQPVFSTNGVPAGSVIPVFVRVSDSAGNSEVVTTSITVVPTTVYVDASAIGRNDGTDWANAFTSLPTALNRSCEGQTIRVASGRYLPSSAQDRFASFRLRSGVTVLGGYAGRAAANPNARDIALYPTILSGDLGRQSDNADNSFQVVVASGTDATTTIDGFTITGGNAAGGNRAEGAGMYAQSGSPTISNCVFLENRSNDRGGGAYFYYGSNPTLKNCRFIRNTADRDYGAGLCLVYNCNASLVSCEFLGNTIPYSGGALWIHYSAPTIINCSFVGNRARHGSALTLTGIYDYPKQTTIMVNCTVTGNQALVGDSIFGDGNELLSASNLILWANIEPAGSLPAVDPRFVRNPNPALDGTWGTADDDYGDLRLRIDSPCIDAGDNSAVPAGITTDIAGNPRFIDIPGVHDPGAIVDMGAYERIAPIADAGYLFDAVRPTVSVKFGFDALASSIAPSDLLLTNLTTGQTLDCGKLCTVSYDSLTRTASWVFNAALPDGNYRAILPVNSVSDDTGSLALGANLTLEFFVLGGDANRDRIVDVNDLSILTRNWNGRGKVFSQGDFNYDGKVDAKDLGILSSHWQQTLPPPLPTAPVRAPTRTPARVATLVL
jgi:predicted outer membrane repeat protein